jgi:hypothetical protein
MRYEKEDLTKYKVQFRRYLELKNIPIINGKCLCPAHDDNNPSMLVNESFGFCFVCGHNIDIFDFAGLLIGASDFPSKKKEVKTTLGYIDMNEKKTKNPAHYELVDPEKYNEIYSNEKLLYQSKFIGACKSKNKDLSDIEKMRLGYGDIIAGKWPYKTENGKIKAVDVRFEGGPAKKSVITFYYTGKSLKAKNAPVCLFNLDLIKKYPDHKIIVLEGAKSASYAMFLLDYGFLPVSWSRGTHNIKKCDWSAIYGREVYFYPDDDQKKDKSGKLFSSDKQPGIKAALEFKKEVGPNLKSLKIIIPNEAARKIKEDGADIVELLEVLSKDEISNYFLNSPEYKPPEKLKPPPRENVSIDDFEKSIPFKILGKSDNGKAYFIGRNNQDLSFKLQHITNKDLLNLAPIRYWEKLLKVERLTGNDWLNCFDIIIELSTKKYFDPDNLRGRGAWRENDGRICYHTGLETIGEYNADRVFLRKNPIKIGIGKPHLERDIIEKMKDTVFKMSFETKIDVMRCLGFASLAPFSGALEWRPQAFLTGPSESGKSSLENYVIKNISIPDRFNGIRTTGPGYYADRKKDSGAVSIEEIEARTESEKRNREALLSIMRGSTSDDTPKGAIGSADGVGRTYMSRDMFLFIAIDSEVSNIADENRLTRINMIKPENNGGAWREIKKDLKKYFTPENCEKLRSLIWDKLKIIMTLGEKISEEIQIQTKKNHRFAISDGMLMSAYIVIWKNKENITEEEIKDFIQAAYIIKKVDEKRDASEEMIETILQEKIRVFFEESQKTYTIGDIVGILVSNHIEAPTDYNPDYMRAITRKEKLAFRDAIEVNGVFVFEKKLAIANRHKEVQKILKREAGYSRMLKRHIKCVDTDKTITRNGQSIKCSLFDVLENFIPF